LATNDNTNQLAAERTTLVCIVSFTVKAVYILRPWNRTYLLNWCRRLYGRHYVV